jgi:uncharacterized surface protein with fasciclin (FAS1) repeats
MSTKSQMKTGGDIAAVLSSDKDFSTLVKAIKAAGLENEFKGKGPYTLFAPTNYAFSRLPKGTLDSLLKPENKSKLRSILLDHVVKGVMTSSDVMKMKSPHMVTSLGGMKITITHTGNTVMVGSGKVTKADIKASNGIIHGISAVLLPPEKGMKMPAGKK